ncbi:hypothetical protein LCGC14_1646690 [marine sediment metagenome]|uniref:Uncharacterized protein n=1 Tax=marine sediment metagenome TaxID=412755 RepID=A0A0F9IKI5_9ZZZZ
MIAGHRWEYQSDMFLHECVGLPWGGVESYQWCIGCGCRITDEELYISKLSMDSVLLLLDIIASKKGFEPIQSGTLQDLKFRKLHDSKESR